MYCVSMSVCLSLFMLLSGVQNQTSIVFVCMLMKIFALLYTIETLFVFEYAVSVKIPKLILFELFICVCMRPKMRLLFICSLKLKANAVEFGQWLCGYRMSKIFG